MADTAWAGKTQEIPASFTTETGWPRYEDCALVTSISTAEEWPIRLQHVLDIIPGVSAVSVGAGWPKFVSDQALGHGAFLTIEIVDDRRLVVSIHRRSAVDFDQSPAVVRDYCEAPLTPNNVPCLSSRQCLHDTHRDARPQFQKTLRKTHTKKGASARMVRSSAKS